MMKTPTAPVTNVDQSLFAEVIALRDRVQIQQGLFELLLERLRVSIGERHHEPLYASEPLPVHPLRADYAFDERHVADSVEDAGPDPGVGDVHSVPTGTWWPMPEKAPHPMVPNPGWESYGIGPPANVIGFSLCGMKIEDMEQAVELVRAAQRQEFTFVPVFLTDHADLSIFRKHGFVAEYLPEPITNTLSLDEPLNRRRLIERKWNISRTFEFEQVMREAALSGDWISNGGPKLEFQSIPRPSSTRTKKIQGRRQGAMTQQPNKRRRRNRTK
jgi:hypothetical protein